VASDPRRLGALLGLLAAVSFGVSAPLARLLLADITPRLLAGLLYLGAGVGLAIYRLARPTTREAPLTRADLPSMLGVVALGGVVARCSCSSASSASAAPPAPSCSTSRAR
jgi:drug/metabolite transporter (DMT)-like permease